MARKDIIMMSQEELKRLPITHKVINKELTQIDAADILGLCDRQVRRIIERVKKEGDKGIIHRLRGKPSNRQMPMKTKDRILNLCKTRYKDFNPTFASEKLLEIDELIVNPETLRLWFIESGITYNKRRGRTHRVWRERKHHFGEMVQLDGSHHDWFESRGPRCVLMGYIDDATNTTFARFYEYEGTLPAMDSFKLYIKKYGIPMSIYLDKHSTYKSTTHYKSIEQELNNSESLSHFEKSLKELGVGVIHANSPQAKGRIERLFQTFQDRLIKEMRLRSINTIKEANNFLAHYLPVFNRRFANSPIEASDFHRSVPEHIDLDKILSIKTPRSLRNDFTIAHDKKFYQILDTINTDKVTVEERVNGRLLISHRDKYLNYKEITQRPVKKSAQKLYIFKPKTIWRPPMDHPYKRPLFNRMHPNITNYKQQKQEELLLINK